MQCLWFFARSNHLQVGREDGGDRELQEHNSAESRDCPFVPHGEVPYCEELDGDPFAEIHAEEEPRPDETVADGEAEIQ